MAETEPIRCLVLTGLTASGKTEASLAIAQRWPIEIISMDSALVYKGMDIGTAKPSDAERASAPHHLIDVLEPTQAYSAAYFARDARQLIGEIVARGHRPVLVGGTLLYFKALFEGLDDLPAAQPELRATIELQAAEQGWPAMHAQLAQVDPITAQRLAPRDAQRIGRALEVWRHTGQPLSSFFQSGNARPSDLSPFVISLEPFDRSVLHQRIALRFDQMLALGLVEEVRRLRARGDLRADMPSMRCVGYRQSWETLECAERLGRDLNSDDLKGLRERGIAATRQLAKRQLTWLRGMTERHLVASDQDDRLTRVLHWAEQAWCSGNGA
ncbi:MAG: tRNA (adenosine(37)-N6)-dimethylallyltransferase MiaA [Alphaproteobacteria bacterium]|nr:tRNA (adenosine(37)-N6)-dimethylallyltransferase MiaA [Alphaproteobacteria bacterium]